MRRSADSSRAGPEKLQALRRLLETAAHIHLGEARRAEGKIAETPSLGVEADIAVQRLDGGAADGHHVDAEIDDDRQWRLHRRNEGREEALGENERPLACHIGRRKRAVHVDLPRHNGAVEMRIGAERQLGLAGQIDRALIRAIA